jgi:hypothetical protein
MTRNTKNMKRRIIGNVLLYLLLMLIYALRACYAIVYIFLSIYILVPLAILVDIIRNENTFAESIKKAIQSCVDEVKDIYK